jgi:hypothetical protein
MFLENLSVWGTLFSCWPSVSGNAFLWKFSQSTFVVGIGHQHILLCHECPCLYNQNFLTKHFLKIVGEFLLCCILCFKFANLRFVWRWNDGLYHVFCGCFIIFVRAKFHDLNIHKWECTLVHTPILCSGHVLYYNSRWQSCFTLIRVAHWTCMVSYLHNSKWKLNSWCCDQW